MSYDEGKIDEMVLALLWLTSFREGLILKAWKGMDWDAMNRLYEKDLISNPKSKAKSIVFTDEGAKFSKELFEKYFGSTNHSLPT